MYSIDASQKSLRAVFAENWKIFDLDGGAETASKDQGVGVVYVVLGSRSISWEDFVTVLIADGLTLCWKYPPFLEPVLLDQPLMVALNEPDIGETIRPYAPLVFQFEGKQVCCRCKNKAQTS